MGIILRYSLVIIVFIFVSLIGITPQITTFAMVNDMFNNEKEQMKEDEGESDQPVNSDQENISAIEAPSLLSSFLKLIFALAIIIGLIIFISKFLKKRNDFLKKHEIIENFGGITVASNKSIQTIKIADRFFVVGVGENIELLMEITDQYTIDQLVQQKANMPTSIKDLRNKLTNNNKTDGSKQNFEMLFTKELNSMKENRKNLYKKMNKRNDSNDH